MLRRQSQDDLQVARFVRRHCLPALAVHSSTIETASSGNVISLERVLTLAGRHQVLPAITEYITDHCLPHTPKDTAAVEIARGECMAAYVKSMRLRQLGDAILTATGGKFAIIKGTQFAQHLYPKPQLRPYTDIDLLIDHGDWQSIYDCLKSLDFSPCPAPETDRREWQWVYVPAPDLSLEVHTDMVHSPNLRKFISLSYQDIAERPNAPASLLAIALVHGMAPNTFKRLRFAVDVCLAARKLSTAVDEAEFQRFVAKRSHRRYTYAGLEIAGRLFGDSACLRMANEIGRRSDRMMTDVCYKLIQPTMREAGDLDRPSLRLAHRMARLALRTAN